MWKEANATRSDLVYHGIGKIALLWIMWEYIKFMNQKQVQVDLGWGKCNFLNHKFINLLSPIRFDSLYYLCSSYHCGSLCLVNMLGFKVFNQ
jgi:hypothetical protein